ncbi:phage protease [Pelosinus sp. IPA-1]|uniref:phage protease n=1 Tax=Pelosinus sp. IPA-1 TaxID=3029569 RepID=UPI002436282D|nr:phage protease [Pelosinus sp. IPA-1]GMB00916.1 hypothetical protein PIPA1_37150 [Pelosinus sp. IPA-1]
MLKIPFFRLGTWKHPAYGDIKATQTFLSEMMDNFKKNVLGREVFIRIGHDKGSGETFGGAEAKGWVKELKQEGDVIYAFTEPATPEDEKLVKDKRYKFASAEYNENYTDRESGKKVGPVLLAIALTNEPFLTKLPEAIVLAEQPDLFIMDYQLLSEDKGGKEKMDILEMLKKLSETVTGFVTGQQKTNEDTTKALAEMKVKLEEAQAINIKLSAAADNSESERKLAVVESQVKDMVAEGIPPVMVEQWKQLAVSEAGSSTIKLADGKEMTQADSMKAMLLAMPKENRIQLGQKGQQGGDPTEAEKIKLAADEDIIAAGGRLDEKTGKYII